MEWSWPLALIARAACPQATVRRADLWAGSWADYDLVYLFQRPESMPRALDKARAEMRRGAWLASLEFEAAGWQPQQPAALPRRPAAVAVPAAAACAAATLPQVTPAAGR